MRALFSFLMLISLADVSAQITFNSCHPLFEDQDYVFNTDGTDATGRMIFTTTPVDGAQTCGGIGTCEFKILWNDTSSRWEFLADDGNGDFSDPYLIYYNMAASLPNPPSLTLGTWVENTAVTESECGGNLSSSNSVLTGDVQDTVLGISDWNDTNVLVLYPNPATEVLNIVMPNETERISVWNMQGQAVFDQKSKAVTLDVSQFASGIYIIRLESEVGIIWSRFNKI